MNRIALPTASDSTSRSLLQRSIPEVFDLIAARTPDRIAVACADRLITYGQLAMWSDTIAANLRQRGVRPGSIVGLFIPRSAEAIAAILGVLKAGAAYLPFDLSYPANLLRYIYEDSAPSLMLVHGACAQAAPAFWGGDVLSMDAIAAAGVSLDVLSPADPDDLAYVMYTSGSTGRPKGVQIPHRGVLRLVLDNPFAELGPDEVLLQLSPLSFDASTFEIWGALLNGGTLAILSAPHPSLDEIAHAIRHHGVTTLWLTAGIFHLMVDHQLDGLRPLRQLLAGGDVLSPAHVTKALRALPNTRLINGYGPTENTTFTCCYTIPKDYESLHPIPIGKVIGRTEAHVLDEAGQPVVEGQTGELYVGGDGLALGYLNRPELTAERFVPHPFDSAPGARLYRTGDRVRMDADHTFHFMGRADRQIKVNGKRVELDEIEAALRRSHLVRDAAVVSFEVGGKRRIAAYVTAAGGKSSSVAELRNFLRQELPDYMQPSTMSVLDELPLSPTGKVDRARLPLPAQETEQPRTPAVTTGVTELELLKIWTKVLGTEGIGLSDHFFDLGGTSLQLVQVHASIQASLKRDAKLLDLFRYTTISALAQWITRGEPPRETQLDAHERARRQRVALKSARPVR